MPRKLEYSVRLGTKENPQGVSKGLCSVAATGVTKKVGQYVIILERHPGGKLLDRLVNEIQKL